MVRSVVALRLVGDAPVVVGHGEFRVEPQGLAVVGDGVVKVALGFVGTTPVVVGRGEFRVEPEAAP